MDSIPQGKQRIFLWDNLKIILILFVVIYHASLPYGFLRGERWCWLLNMILIPYAMSTFTIISGYWLKPRPVNVLARKYLLPCLLVLFLCYGFFPDDYEGKSQPWSLDVMWYLWALFFYYLITPRLLKYNLNFLLFASVLLSLVSGFFPFLGLSFSLGRMIGFYPFFLLGIKIRSSAKWRAISTNQKAIMAARVVFVVTLILYFVLFLHDESLSNYISFFYKYNGNWHRIFYTVFTYLVVTVLSLSLILSMPDKEYWFTKYGSRSLTPYLLHQLIIYTLSWTLAVPIMDKWYGYVFYMLVIPALCMMTVHSRIDGFIKKLTS